MIIGLNDKITSHKIGNKAKYLMTMKEHGFRVPDGFTLDSDTYSEIMEFNNIATSIQELVADISKDTIKEGSYRIKALFDNLVIPETIVTEITHKIDQNKKYAVRSSGLKEDLADLAFAGQYDTFLNVQGTSDIKEAILNCYKSMYSEVVLSYLFNHGISAKNLEMAVVVQEMVASEKSGIIFTVNPVTGNDKEVVIEIAAGLGDNIVSGRVNPERYCYNWFEEKADYEERNQLLSAKELNEIADHALRLQMMLGYPCDIEFAIEKEKLYLLQVRAITKIMYAGIPDQWTTADFKDGGVSATVCTPFMWSLYEYIWENTLKKFVLDSNILKEKDWRKAGDMFYGRPYWNLCVVKSAMAKIPGYKEREFDLEVGVKITYEGNGSVTKINPKTIVGIIKMARAQKKIVAERKANANNLKADLLEKYNNYEKDYSVASQGKEFEKIWYHLIKEDYLYSEGTYFWQIFINTVHQSLIKDKLLKYVSESEYFNLIGGLDQISHLLPFYDMWDMTREIKKDEKSRAFWSGDVSDICLAYEKGSEQYSIPKVKEYIKLYGYHSKKELDVTYPCYSEDVESVIRMFQETMALEEGCSPAADRKKQREIYSKQLESIHKQIQGKKYHKIKKNIGDMRSMLWWREEFRDISTRFYYIIRLYTRKLADLYVKEGVLEQVEDIWYLKIEDILGYIDGKITKLDLNKIISKNCNYYQSFRHFMSENEIGAVFDRQGVEESNKSDGIRGIGCNNGTVTGTARVIESLEEIDRLQVGDILVTRFTDTGWTSKFAILKGIVTEYGGILCHAAIVSREYGIPCVVCTQDATKLIKDGSIITMNGTTGEIQIEKE